MKRTEFDRVVIVGELLDDTLDSDTIYVLTYDAQPHAVSFCCPCGCDSPVYIPVSDLVKKERHWLIEFAESNGRKQVSLSPSLQRLMGCKSHFFIKSNRVEWCN